MRPTAKALLSAARSVGAAEAPCAARQGCTTSGGGITGTVVRGQTRTALTPACEHCRPAFGLPLDAGLSCARRFFGDTRSQPHSRLWLAACQPTEVTARNVLGCLDWSSPQTSRASKSTRNSSGAVFGGQPCSVSGRRWAASIPGRSSTAARAVAEEPVATRDPEAPAVGQSAEHDQAPVGAAASQVSQCGEHTGETDDDEEAAKVDIIPWPVGMPRVSDGSPLWKI